MTLNGEIYQSTISTDGFQTKSKSEQHIQFDFSYNSNFLWVPFVVTATQILCKSHLFKTMLRKCFTKVFVCQKDTHHANKNPQDRSIWTRSVGNFILVCGRNQDEASGKNRHQATEHSLKLVDPMMVAGQKPRTRISTRVIIFRSFRFALKSRGKHNFTLFLDALASLKTMLDIN